MPTPAPTRLSHAREAVTDMVQRDLDTISARGGRVGGAADALKAVSGDVVRPTAPPEKKHRRWLTVTVTVVIVGSLTTAGAVGLMVNYEQAQQRTDAERLATVVAGCNTAYDSLATAHSKAGVTYASLSSRGIIGVASLSPIESDLAKAQQALATPCPVPDANTDATDTMLATNERSSALIAINGDLDQDVSRATGFETVTLHQRASDDLGAVLDNFDDLTTRYDTLVKAAGDLDVSTSNADAALSGATDTATSGRDALATDSHLDALADAQSALGDSNVSLTAALDTLEAQVSNAKVKQDAIIAAAADPRVPGTSAPSGGTTSTSTNTGTTTQGSSKPKATTAPAKPKPEPVAAKVTTMYFTASSGIGTVTVTAHVATNGSTSVTVKATVAGHTITLSGPGTLNGEGTYTGTLSGIEAGNQKVTVSVSDLSDSSTIPVY